MTTYLKNKDGYVFSTDFPEYHKDCEKMTQKEGQALYIEQLRKEALKDITVGDTIYGIVNSVPSSGMSRTISFYRATKDKKIICINHTISKLCGYPIAKGKSKGLKISGCGSDMIFTVVYNLGAALWPKGTLKPHSTLNGEPDCSGGYALKHSSL